MTVLDKACGKWDAVSALIEFVRYFSNWPEVWEAYRNRRRIPDIHLRNGLSIIHEPSDALLDIFREIFEREVYTSRGFYQPRANDVVLDIGANIGVFPLFLNSLSPGITVHCFEPAGEAFERLKRNVALNGLGTNTFLHPYAIWDRNGLAYLAKQGLTTERALLKDSAGCEDSSLVQTLSLARALDICGANRIHLLKVDIEGSELEMVLSSDKQAWRSIDRVAMEFHGVQRPGCLAILTAALRDRGFLSMRVNELMFNGSQGILQASR